MSVITSMPESEDFSSFSKSTQSEEDVTENDVLYDSLCSLSNPLNKMKKQRKHKISPALSLDEKKTLTFVLNECLSTNGKDPIHNDPNALGKKRTLYEKTINSIGTSLNNCDVSDNISIDIEGESTYLPLMCKLMIIVEGAAYERGKRLLLNDSAIQAGEGNLVKLLAENEHDIPIIIESSCKNYLVRNQNNNENSLMKIRSHENINYDEYNEQMEQLSQKRRNQYLDRSLRAGSLTDITSSGSSSFTENNSNYFSKKVEDFNHEFYEYLSTPFYGYQRKTLDKIDFSNGIQEEFITKKIETTNSEKNAQMFNETVEIYIPIQLKVPEEHQLVPMRLSPEDLNTDQNQRYRNQKEIVIDHLPERNCPHENHFVLTGFQQQPDFNGQFMNQLASFRTFSNNMQQYFDQRVNRFETDFDLNFFRDEDCSNYAQCEPIEVEHHPVPHHVIHVDHDDTKHNESLKNCSIFHKFEVNSDNNNHQNMQNVQQSIQSVVLNGNGANLQRKSSVTNLMYMRVIDGNIITSI